MKKILYPLLACALLFSCQKADNLIVKEEDDLLSKHLIGFEKWIKGPLLTEGYTRQLPDFLQDVGMQVVPADGPKAALGRVLFYDKNLSADRTISCSSCHQQALAFSDKVPLSQGVGGMHSLRNSMPLGNVASVSAHYNPLQEVVPPFLWDQRATTISDLSRMAFTSPNEMGMTMPGVVERVREGEYYPLLFKNTYGETEVTEARIMECLTEFVGAIGGGNSPLDRALEKTRASLDMANTVSADTLRNAVYYGTADTVITITTVFRGMDGLGEQENRGRTLFVTHCTKCHSPVRPFQEVIAACNGLEMNYKDLGLAAVTKRPEDVGVFKSPSLRNIALTAPYMHDGRFGTLQQVIDFYSDDIQPHPNLHPLLRNANGSPGLKLTLAQKTQLLAFLRTLTDADITQDPKFSDPFKR